MRIAMAGPSGTGKSTIAEYIHNRYGLPINPIGSRSVAEAMGLKRLDGTVDPYLADSLGVRAEFQRRLLTEKTAWEAAHDSFVTDRTTLDNLAYTALHHIDSLDDAYYGDAIAAMARYDVVVFCPVSIHIHLGDDPARRKGMPYHLVFDALLSELVERHATNVVTLWSADLDKRRTRIDALF